MLACLVVGFRVISTDVFVFAVPDIVDGSAAQNGNENQHPAEVSIPKSIVTGAVIVNVYNVHTANPVFVINNLMSFKPAMENL